MNLYSFKKEHARLLRLHDKYICILNQLFDSNSFIGPECCRPAIVFRARGIVCVVYCIVLSQTVFILPLSLSILKGIYTVIFEEGLHNLQYLDFLRGYH